MEPLKKAFARVRERISVDDSERQKLSHIRDESLQKLDELWDIALKNLKKNGFEVFFARTKEDALSVIKSVIGSEKKVVKSKTNLTYELDLRKFFESEGIEFVETDLGDRILQLTGDPPSHPTAPISHLSAEDVKRVLIERGILDREEVSVEEMTDLVRKDVLFHIRDSKVGILGVNGVCAKEGCCFTIHNEGNVTQILSNAERVVMLVGLDKIYESMEEASLAIKLQTQYATGSLVPSFVEFVGGPSKTADIEKRYIRGMYGPREVVLVVIDNGRRELLSSQFRDILKCIGCGSCIVHCPVYNAEMVGSSAGIVRSAVLGIDSDVAFKCTMCSLCNDNCPSMIELNSLLLELRRRRISRGDVLKPHQKLYRKALSGRIFEYDFDFNIRNDADTVLFAGCFTLARRRDTLLKGIELLNSAEFDFSFTDEVCCGSPLKNIGLPHEGVLNRLLERLEGKRVVCMCVACHSVLSGAGVDAIHIGEVLLDLIEEGKLSVSNFDSTTYNYHHSCHMSKDFEKRFLSMLDAFDFNIESLPRWCCGGGGGVRSAFPELTLKMSREIVERAGNSTIITPCNFCAHNLTEAGGKVLDVVEFIWHHTKTTNL
jgi:L-lactate dehydrogenase complex protein LldG